MQNNGFYACMKTDTGVQAVYIDEETFRTQQERAFEVRQQKKRVKEQKKEKAAISKMQKATYHLLKQELKLLGMGAILYFGYAKGLVALSFLVPVLVSFQTVICFRAGKWYGRYKR